MYFCAVIALFTTRLSKQYVFAMTGVDRAPTAFRMSLDNSRLPMAAFFVQWMLASDRGPVGVSFRSDLAPRAMCQDNRYRRHS